MCGDGGCTDFPGHTLDVAIEHMAKVNNIPRPAGYTLLHDNVTMFATRVDTEFGDVPRRTSAGGGSLTM